MKIHAINDFSNKYVIELLKKNLQAVTHSTLTKNYHPNYSTTPGNLFFILDQGRYKNGNYFVVEDDNGEYVCSAGWNEYEDVALLLTRAYIKTAYRRKYFLSEFLLPLMFKETTKYNKLWITCNEYNKSIYHAFERMAEGKSVGLFDQWPDTYKKFKPIGIKIVYNTEQYVAEYNKNELYTE